MTNRQAARQDRGPILLVRQPDESDESYAARKEQVLQIIRDRHAAAAPR